jgi:prepilin-type N-terminal cleavage/methylation domain-containing protein
MNTLSKYRRGFGLIEILVTLGVLSVGILGVAALQSTITKQSLDNKTNAEALAIAQSRIEEMRNYSTSVSTLDEFNALYANTSGYTNSTTVTGISADFSRTESIATFDYSKAIAVNVAWTDSDNDAQSVELNTTLSYTSPRSVGDVALEAMESLVDAPTGRARLGEGQLPADADTIDNGDGTALYQDGGIDLMLVYDDQIVLTLAEACQTDDGTCIDFVRIKGRIYIDTASQGITPGEVYVVASDAAFCARHYTDGGTTYTITQNTSTTVSTSSGDYEFFDYTCYIGGGWHGNVGLVISGGLSQRDKACLGDPTATEDWARPELATRRAYRGMLYKIDGGTASGREEVASSGGGTIVRYYSQGIADSTELPDPASGDATHDFVLGSMSPSKNDDSDCIDEGLVVRADSNVNGTLGDLFTGVPPDFVCLNNGLVDYYDGSVYGNDATCPYDPTDPPSTRHIVSGNIDVAASDLTESPASLAVASMNVVTSDGSGNCLVTPFAYSSEVFSASYSCDVYDWGNGWNGNIDLSYSSSEISCNPNQFSLSNVTGNSSGHNFNGCAYGGSSDGGGTPPPGSTDPAIDATISGTVTASGSRRLSAASISDGGVCTIAGDGLSYTCSTNEFADVTWTGTIILTPSSGAVCSSPSNNGVFSFYAISAGEHTQNAQIANNSNQCP